MQRDPLALPLILDQYFVAADRAGIPKSLALILNPYSCQIETKMRRNVCAHSVCLCSCTCTGISSDNLQQILNIAVNYSSHMESKYFESVRQKPDMHGDPLALPFHRNNIFVAADIARIPKTLVLILKSYSCQTETNVRRSCCYYYYFYYYYY